MDYEAIVIGVGIAGVIFAGLAWSLSGRALRYRMATDLMRDYRDYEMGEAIKTLWDYQRKVGTKQQLEDDFLRRLKKMKKNEGKENKEKEDKYTEVIHKYRRRVAQFYRCMAALHYGRVVPDKLLYDIWHEKTLEIIPKIVIPLETALIKFRKDNPDDEVYKKEFELLNTLYEHSKGPGITIL